MLFYQRDFCHIVTGVNIEKRKTKQNNISMWKKRLIWKNVTLQCEVTKPEDIEEEVNTQKDSFVLKPSVRP